MEKEMRRAQASADKMKPHKSIIAALNKIEEVTIIAMFALMVTSF